MSKTFIPTVRIETFSSPEAGYAGEAYSSTGGGHRAQERLSYPNEPIKVVKPHSSLTEADIERDSEDKLTSFEP